MRSKGIGESRNWYGATGWKEKSLESATTGKDEREKRQPTNLTRTTRYLNHFSSLQTDGHCLPFFPPLLVVLDVRSTPEADDDEELEGWRKPPRASASRATEKMWRKREGPRGEPPY